MGSDVGRDGCRRCSATPAKTYRAQLAVLARPDAEQGHDPRGGELEDPPEGVGGDGVGVERGEEEVDGVEGYGEVGDELGAGDEEED